MCKVSDLRQSVLAKNDRGAPAAGRTGRTGNRGGQPSVQPGQRQDGAAGSGIELAAARGVPVAALTADLATENDAQRLARSGVPVKQVLTDGLCHLEAEMLRGHLEGWLPDGVRLLFVENVGNLVCPASYDLGESLGWCSPPSPKARTSR